MWSSDRTVPWTEIQSHSRMSLMISGSAITARMTMWLTCATVYGKAEPRCWAPRLSNTRTVQEAWSDAWTKLDIHDRRGRRACVDGGCSVVTEVEVFHETSLSSVS